MPIGFEQRDAELVAAEAARGVRAAQHRRRKRADTVQHAVAFHVAVGVVDALEPVEVDEDDRQPVVVAESALRSRARASSENAWWLSSPSADRGAPGRRAPRSHGRSSDDALHDRRSIVSFSRRSTSITSPLARSAARSADEAPEDTAEQQELRHDLARSEAERFALAGVVACDRGERPTDAHRWLGDGVSTSRPSSAMNVGRSPSCARRPETHERRDHVVRQPLVDHLEGQLPALRPKLRPQSRQHRGRVSGCFPHS